MKRRILLFFVVAALLTLASATSIRASAHFSIHGYTDKTFYKPGDTGTLKLWIYNDGTDDLILKNVTIHYPWYDLLWGGNETIKPATDTVIAPKGNWSGSTTFIVPNDGRAARGNAIVNGVTDKATDTEYIEISVISGEENVAVQEMDALIFLLTGLIILTIVCTAIIAATIFLTARRPQIMWKSEEKE